MALENPQTQYRRQTLRHLSAVEQPQRRATVYNSPARAAIVLQRMIIVSTLVTVFVLSWIFGYQLLAVLGVAFLACIGGLAVILALDALRSSR